MAVDPGSSESRNSLLTVACVLRSGGDYNAEYVAKLRLGVTKHLPVAHRFVCLSDSEVPCEKIPLKNGWPGWWSKMELFLLPPPVLYFDLDTVIVGDLSDIAKQATQPEFTVLRDFYRPEGFGSGMMAWGIQMRRLYDEFSVSPHGIMGYDPRGDQAFIEDHAKDAATWQKQLPSQVVSYKAHVRAPQRASETGNGKPPNDARVVCFHGRPRPKEVGWLAA